VSAIVEMEEILQWRVGVEVNGNPMSLSYDLSPMQMMSSIKVM